MFRKDYLRKPEWIKVKIPTGDEYKDVYQLLEKHGLSTVCQEARCPNINECWNKKSATIMILGKICTRACRFCSVNTGNPNGHINSQEPENTAEVINKLGLKYVVITSVTRDDLEDGGARVFFETVKEIKKLNELCKVEVLIPDFKGDIESLKKVIDAKPDVINHNIEVVQELFSEIRPEGDYETSLKVLRNIKNIFI